MKSTCSSCSALSGSSAEAQMNGWNRGFYCPCRGSTFDFAGRVFRNKPAPTNLEVPPHRYLSDTRLVVGEDDTA